MTLFYEFFIIYIRLVRKDSKMKKYLIGLLVLVAVLNCGVFLLKQYKQNTKKEEPVPEVQTATNRDELMEDIDSIDDDDIYRISRFYLKEIITDKHCFSTWRPHGGFWELECYETKQECKKNLDEQVNFAGEDSVRPNRCVEPEFVSAWCINRIKMGYKRYFDDFDEKSYDDVKTMVCTKTKKKCESVKKYQKSEEPYDCEGVQVLSIPNETDYFIWSDKEVDQLIKRNEKNK